MLTSCQDTETKEIPVYEGPLRVVENVERYQSEDDHITVKMVAPMLYEYQDGNIEFPEGIDIDFYDELGKITSTLHANRAQYFKEEDQWQGQGDVEIKNIEKNEQLNTEELFWKPDGGDIFTDKFVTIRQQSDVVYGDGLDAKQDLSNYKIRKVHGMFTIDE